MSYISYDELDQLAGEMLPERTVLSTVNPYYWGGSEHGHGNVAIARGGDHGGTTILSACQAVNNAPLAGLLGGNSSLTCIPAAIAR